MQNLGLPQLTKNKLSNPISNKHISFSVSLSGRRILLSAAITEKVFRLLTIIHSAPVVVNCNKNRLDFKVQSDLKVKILRK